MNRKLMALAVASALAVPLTASAADSTVTIFGRVLASYDGVQINQAAGATNLDRRQKAITDNYGMSRWGMKIKEDLGGGLNAIAQVEFAFRPGTGSAEAARQQWVGLSSKNWGSAKFGRVQSPFKDFAGGGTLDVFGSTALQARGSGGALSGSANGFGAATHVDHAVRYDSPSFGGGFSAAVLWMPSDATQAEAGGNNTGGDGGENDFQLGLKYKFGSTGEIFGGYSNNNASNAQRLVITNGRAADDEEAWRIGGSWSFGNFKIAGQYEDIENAQANGAASCSGGATGTGNEAAPTGQCNSALNTNGDGKIFFLTGQYKLGNTTFVLQGGQTKADAIGAVAIERKAKNLTVGAIHKLSKRSSLFGGFQRVSVDGFSTVASGGGTVGAAAALAIQPDRSVWTLGMRHNF